MTRIHHDVAEELLEAVWVLGERGPVAAEAVLTACHVRASDGALRVLAVEGLVTLEGDRVRLTAAGEAQAGFVIRRQRLGELLALGVMAFRHLEEKQAVCEFEHVITPADIDGICTQLGHPTHCPDGEPIPPGPCCAAAAPPGAVVVRSLATVTAGQRGRILYVRRRVPARARVLQSYGILGGARFELRQRFPTQVLIAEGVEIALDSQVAADVFVLLEAESGR